MRKRLKYRFSFNQKMIIFLYGVFLPAFFVLGIFLSVITGTEFLRHRQPEQSLWLKPLNDVKIPPRINEGPETYTFLGFYESRPGIRSILVRRESTGDIGAFHVGQRVFAGPFIKSFRQNFVEVIVNRTARMIHLADSSPQSY